MIGYTVRQQMSAGVATCAMALAGCQSVPPPPPPLAELATEAAQLALSTCLEAGFATTVLVTDANGRSVAMLSADGANPRTHQIAPTKIAIVRKYGVPSSQIATRVDSDATLAADIAADPEIGTARGGALPIEVDGAIIAIIAVSGAPSGAQDELCAEPAVRLVLTRMSAEAGEVR